MEPPSTYRILISNDSGRRLSPEPLKNTLRLALSALDFEDGELSVRLTSSEAMRELNQAYRGIGDSTDVLTFPAEPGFPTGSKEPLGDIAISVEQASRQASVRKISLHEELAYLGIHGLLHLKGFEDETDEEREVMLAEMTRIGTLVGLPSVEDWHTMAVGALK